MNTTQNLNLGKPLVSEKYDISVFNSNADKIDAAVKALQDKTTTAGTDRAGIVMLTDSISSDSTTTAATANSVKQVNDKIEAKVDKVTGKNLSSNDLTDDLKANYDAAFSHSISEHARNDATLTQASSSNGSIRINGSETVVYTHPASHSAGIITEDSAHRFVTDEEKSSYADKYTKNEVDNKLAALETNIDWKESVDTFSDIAAAYPNPQDGWTVNVKDTDYTYRYNGSAWVTISANAIPKATSTVDGLLSKEDKTNLDDANVKKHTHSNKAVLDGITAANVQTWNNAINTIDDNMENVTAEINALKKSVSDGKTLVANAVTAKGVSTATDAAFQTIADSIGKIPTGIDEKEHYRQMFTATFNCQCSKYAGIQYGYFGFDDVDGRNIQSVKFRIIATTSLSGLTGQGSEKIGMYLSLGNYEEEYDSTGTVYFYNTCITNEIAANIQNEGGYDYGTCYSSSIRLYADYAGEQLLNANFLISPKQVILTNGTVYNYENFSFPATTEEKYNFLYPKVYSMSCHPRITYANYYIKQTLTEMYKGIVLQDNEREVETTGDPYMQMTLPVSPYVKTFNFRIGFKNTTGKSMTLSDSRVEIIFKNKYDNILKRYYFSADMDATVGAGNTNYYYSGNIDIKTGLSPSVPIVCADIVFMTDTKTGFIMSFSISDVTFTI